MNKIKDGIKDYIRYSIDLKKPISLIAAFCRIFTFFNGIMYIFFLNRIFWGFAYIGISLGCLGLTFWGYQMHKEIEKNSRSINALEKYSNKDDIESLPDEKKIEILNEVLNVSKEIQKDIEEEIEKIKTKK